MKLFVAYYTFSKADASIIVSKNDREDLIFCQKDKKLTDFKPSVSLFGMKEGMSRGCIII